jgi:type II secretory pathway component PulF
MEKGKNMQHTRQSNNFAGPLILYTRKFSALIDAGVSLMRSMAYLAETTEDEKIREANAFLMARVKAGATLSDAMKERLEVFSHLYIAFIRAGEIGGVLQDALSSLASWLEQEREAWERLQTQAVLMELMRGRDSSEAQINGLARNALARSRRMGRIASFCRLFEMMLVAGVPLELALATAADALVPEEAEVLQAGIEQRQPEQPLSGIVAQVEALKPVVASMVEIGESHACLDHMLRKAAEFYDAEARSVLHWEEYP